MAKIRVRGLGRLLLIVMAVLLALPMGAEGVYGEHAAAAQAASGAGRTGPPAPPLGIRLLREPRIRQRPLPAAPRRTVHGRGDRTGAPVDHRLDRRTGPDRRRAAPDRPTDRPPGRTRVEIR
ncbi:hypothetical protein Srufu_033640 [Streptomyces libani subsp. rufus]|nr:hypothetical protein Srufu_033640 [Streptomyces libani subsp. rufus]